MNTFFLKQTFDEMRRQPVAASVTIIGTAFAIFLIMTVMMINSTSSVPIPPESNRDRILYGKYIHTQQIEGQGERSAGLTRKLAERLYRGLEGIDTMTIYDDNNNNRVEVKQHGHLMKMLYLKRGDEAFFSVFDHKLLAGRFFDRAAVDAHASVALLTESAARAVTGSDPEGAVGQTIMVDHKPTTIIGVVADNTPLATHAFGEIFMPLEDGSFFGSDLGLYGWLSVAMLRNPAYTQEDIRRQVIERYDKLNADLEASNLRAIYHEQPFTTRVLVNHWGSNTTPSTEEADLMNLLLILFLMIVPAINMSAMTQSRLSRRMTETGIKRAYGATRCHIFRDLLAENMVLTLIGGAVGLLFSIVGAWLFSSALFNGTTIRVDNLNIPWQILLNWRVFAFALCSCFVLNLLSAGIPAWRASRIAPVDALKGNH